MTPVKIPATKRFWYGVLAGVMISLGCIVYMQTREHLLGSFLFTVGILSVLAFDLHLFTGRVASIVKYPQEEVLFGLMQLMFMWWENYIGCWFVSWCIHRTRNAEVMIGAAAAIVVPKILDSPTGLFTLGMLCNILIYIAVYSYNKSERGLGILMSIIAIMVFVNCGFEHSIADSFFMLLADTTVRAKVHVLVPVTLGNCVGALIPALILDR